MNELPFPEDQSLGFIRRLQFISFDVIIPKERQNKALAQELVADYPGIFNWIVRGSKELRRRKFIFPDSEGNRRQILLAQLQMNPVIAWVNSYQMRWEARARNEIGIYIPTEVLLKSLAQFCEDNNVECPSKQKFGQTMAKIGNGFYKKRRQGGFQYLIYGCTEERLFTEFIIKNEDLHIDYVEERGTFIDEDD
jgi:putative DNA primase/helicase